MITRKQHDILRTALGLDESTTPTQNHICRDADDPDCQALLHANLMTAGIRMQGGLTYFFVTDYGKTVAKEEQPEAPSTEDK